VWANIMSQMSAVPAICLLMAVTDSALGNLQQLLQWCVKNGFELIEWIPPRQLKEKGESSLVGK